MRVIRHQPSSFLPRKTSTTNASPLGRLSLCCALLGGTWVSCRQAGLQGWNMVSAGVNPSTGSLGACWVWNSSLYWGGRMGCSFICAWLVHPDRSRWWHSYSQLCAGLFCDIAGGSHIVQKPCLAFSCFMLSFLKNGKKKIRKPKQILREQLALCTVGTENFWPFAPSGQSEAAVTQSGAGFQKQMEVVEWWSVSVVPAGNSWPQTELVQPHSQAITWVRVRDLCWEKTSPGLGVCSQLGCLG